METPKVPLSVRAVHCASCLLSLWEMRALASLQTSSWLASSVISWVSLSLDNAVCVWVYFSHWYVSAQLCLYLGRHQNNTQIIVRWSGPGVWRQWADHYHMISWRSPIKYQVFENRIRLIILTNSFLSAVCMVASVHISQGFKWRRQSPFLTPAQVQAFIFWMLQQERCTSVMEIGVELFQIATLVPSFSLFSGMSVMLFLFGCWFLPPFFFFYHFLFSILSPFWMNITWPKQGSSEVWQRQLLTELSTVSFIHTPTVVRVLTVLV